MTTNLQMFLLAAKELNFSRAAEKAYVTPQCLSDHIKRLEEQYGISLFIRKPRLQLTPEGKAMVRYFTRIQALEDSMKNELADISGGSRGTIRFGIPITRGNILVPQVVTQFRQRFPNVDVDIRLNDTKALEEMLLAGNLDLFLGVDAGQHALFQRRLLCQEPLYLVVSQAALENRLSAQCPIVCEDFLRHGADLRLLQDIPFVQGHSGSTTTIAVEQLMLKQNIQFQIPVRVSSFNLLIDFCRMGNYATICSRSHIRQVMELEHNNVISNPMHVFAVRGASKKMEIELITHRDTQPLEYLSVFAKMMGQMVLQEDETICSWMAKRNIML